MARFSKANIRESMTKVREELGEGDAGGGGEI